MITITFYKNEDLLSVIFSLLLVFSIGNTAPLELADDTYVIINKLNHRLLLSSKNFLR